MPGTYYAKKAGEYISKERDKPFFLMVSFYEPHSPFHFPVEYRGKFDPTTFTVPKFGPEDDWHIPAIFRDLTAAEKQGITAAYFTSMEYLDRNVGRLLDALKKLGRDKDTIVVLSGDHGYMLGHHGRFEKHCCYEPAIRAPLLVRLLGVTRPSTSSTALVEFIDIVPTILDGCGATIPESVQGRSLMNVLKDGASNHRDAVFVEYSENEEAMVRTERWKLIYTTGKRKREDGYETGKPLPGRVIQLFDVKTDPDETTNVAAKPDYKVVVDDLITKLVTHLSKTAREAQLIPKTDDPHTKLEHLLQTRDVQPKK